MVWQSIGFTHDTYLMVCQPIGFTHRRIHRASPRVSGRPVSHTHSTRTVSLSIMHVHVRGIETTHIARFEGMLANRIHSPSNPSCLAPCLWSPGLTHHSPCTVSLSTMHAGERHTWRLVLPFDLRSYRIQTNSSKRRATFALFEFQCSAVDF